MGGINLLVLAREGELRGELCLRRSRMGRMVQVVGKRVGGVDRRREKKEALYRRRDDVIRTLKVVFGQGEDEESDEEPAEAEEMASGEELASNSVPRTRPFADPWRTQLSDCYP